MNQRKVAYRVDRIGMCICSLHRKDLLLLTYLLTPRCRVLPEQLTGLQLLKKFPAFHGTPRFIKALTSVRHLSLSWVSPIQSIYPHTTSWRSILILSTHLRLGLPIGLFPSGFPTTILLLLLLLLLLLRFKGVAVAATDSNYSGVTRCFIFSASNFKSERE